MSNGQVLNGDTTEAKFFIGYLAGYASAVGGVDRDHARAISTSLFNIAFGSKRANAVHALAFDLIERGDEQVCLGKRCGSRDGAAFLERVENASLLYITEALRDAIVSGEVNLEDRFVDV